MFRKSIISRIDQRILSLQEYWQKRWEKEHIENLTSQLEVQAQKCFIENLVKLVAKKDTEIIEKEADIAKKNAELTRKEAYFERKEAEILWLQKQIDEVCQHFFRVSFKLVLFRIVMPI